MPRSSRTQLVAFLAVTSMMLTAACTEPDDGSGASPASTDTTAAAEASTTVDEDASPSDTEPTAVPYRDAAFPRITSTAAVELVTVGEGEDAVTLLADVYEPVDDERESRAAMVLFFGGGFVGGERDSVGMQALASFVARHGFVVAAVDYRVLGRAPVDGAELSAAARQAVLDGAASVEALRASAADGDPWRIDPERVFVGGISAGGIIAASLATGLGDAPAPEAALGGFGPVAGAFVISGAVADLAVVDAADAPLFIAHEELDPLVPCGEGAEGSSNTGVTLSGGCALLERAEEVGLLTEGYIVEDQAGHVSFTPSQYEEFLDAATDFLARFAS